MKESPKKAEILHKKSPQQRDLSYYLGLGITHHYYKDGWSRTSTGFIQDVLVVGDDIEDVMFTCYMEFSNLIFEIPDDTTKAEEKRMIKWKELNRPPDWTYRSVSGRRSHFNIDHGFTLKAALQERKSRHEK